MKFEKPVYCKPCWELKYCPYGFLVEMMPFPKDPTYESAGDGPDALARSVDFFLHETDHTDAGDVFNAAFHLLFMNPMMRPEIAKYDPEEIRCRIFGHTCPVFIYGASDTETKDVRKSGRYIPRDLMLKVVRRDNYRCQRCGLEVPDDQVEFDHVIPHTKGGPLSVQNIRLLCRKCNREKSDSLKEILDPADDPIG